MIYRKLKVWVLSKELAVDLYKITMTFPDREKFGLSLQMTRAAISIASNIAEGASRSSNKEQIHFIEIAYGSLMEVSCQLEIAFDIGFINEDNVKLLQEKIEKLAIKLSNYKKSLQGLE